MKNGGVRVLIVDDHEIFRAGLRMSLSAFDGLSVVGEAVDGAKAVDAVGELEPDVVLMDLRMPEVDGIGATRSIVTRFPGTHVLVLSTFDGEDLVAAALGAGAGGYVLKTSPPEDIAAAIRLCARGYTVVGPGMLGFARSDLAGLQGSGLDEAIARLSERELEVLRLIGRGLMNREIAERLGLSEGTVRNYVSGLLSQLSANHRTELALIANTVLARTKLR